MTLYDDSASGYRTYKDGPTPDRSLSSLEAEEDTRYKQSATVLPLGGNKNDQGKAMFALFPPQALDEICKVLNYGATKYGVRNWEKGIVYSRLFSATMRHLWAWWRKEEVDSETGISHLAHAGCNILFLLHFEHFSKTSPSRCSLDDRPEYQDTGIIRSDK